MITTLTLIISILLLIYRYKKNCNGLSKIPSPPGYPVLGQYSQYLSAELVKNIRQKGLMYYPIYKEWMFGINIVHLMHPEDIKIVLTNRSNINKMVLLLNKWLGSSVFSSNGEKCCYKRKLITKAFCLKTLVNYVDIFQQNAESLVNTIQKQSKDVLEVDQYFSKYLMKCVKAFTIGTDSTLDDCTYLKTMNSIKKCIIHRMKTPWLFKNLMYNNSPTGQKEAQAVRTLHSYTYKEIENRIIKRNNEKIDIKQDNNPSALDTLLTLKENGADINEKEIREEIDAFLMAGHDTTVINLSLLLMLLANHETVQDKIIEEMHSVLGNLKKVPNYSDLKNLTYMEQCIKECLRLYPSLPILFRKCLKPFTTHTGYTVPEKTVLIIEILNLHHNPHIYPDPEKFDPDRFLPENVKQRHPFAFIPFSAGSRNCLGQKLAIIQIKLALCAVLKRFVLEPVDTPQTVTFIPGLTLTTEEKIKIKFKQRSLGLRH